MINGVDTVLFNNNSNSVWKSKNAIRCSICKKYCNRLYQLKSQDEELTVCYFNKNCFYLAMETLEFVDDYLMCRCIECPTSTVIKRKIERGKMTLKKRWSIFKRDNFKCVICGCNKRLEVDHIIPISKGGKSVINNLQTLCFNCNRGKSDE